MGTRTHCWSMALTLALILGMAQLGQSAEDNSVYRVMVNGRPVAVYRAHVWDPGYIPSYGGPYWFCSFDLDGEATVEVTTARPLDKLLVLPESRGVRATITGAGAVLKMNKPAQLAFQPDGKNGPLLIFANPAEVNPPKENDPNVKHFGPGVHDAGAIELTDGQTLYLAAGAVVKGGVHAKGANITIRGRGILDGYSYERFRGPTRYPVLLDECRNVRVEGIIIKDGWSWTFVPRGCDGVWVENVKLLCSRVENGDGIDIVNSRNVTIVNSFIRTDDDCIAPKGMDAAGGQAVENIRVEHCILWTDKAHIWRIGCESRAAAMRNMVFRDLDILHFPDLWTHDEVPFCISIEPAEDMPVQNLLFEDIRIRTAGQRGFIDVRPKVTQWARKPTPGRIENVVFRNIAFTGPAGAAPGRIRVSGPGPNHNVAGVRFENVTRDGTLVTATSPNVEVLGFVHGIAFEAARSSPPPTPAAPMKGVTINPPPQHRPMILAEARRPRGLIAAQGGASGPAKAAVDRLQAGLKESIGVTLHIVEDTSRGMAIVIGDCPQAAAEGLVSERLPEGAFEIRTTRSQVLIVGKGDGLLRGVNAFLAHFLSPSERAGAMGTDLIIAPASLSGR